MPHDFGNGRRKVALLGQRRQVVQLDRYAELAPVEEVEAFEMADDLRVRFGERRVIDRTVLGRPIRETDLLCEDRLPCAGGAGKDDERAHRDPTAEDPVELRVARSQAFHHDPDASASTLSTISAFEKGLRITTSAPSAPFGLAVSMRTGMEAVLGSAFRVSKSSRPSITGIIRSVTMTSGLCSWIASSAACP